MSRAPIGRTVRRLRLEQSLSQQALATRLGISASYLNLIEHDQRKVTATLLGMSPCPTPKSPPSPPCPAPRARC
jgi:DNA-binding XRE family transcriptional regulator